MHSIVANWTARRTYEFWRDSTNLESHFGIGYGERDIAQYIGTETRADANAGANRRSDGTGAISVETASNSTATDPWNVSQVEELIALGVWAHQRHGIPLRICRTSSDPGFGYHSMFAAWSTSGTACPGKARIKQFREVVFPGIVARATGKTTPPKEVETEMTPTQEALLRQVATDLTSLRKDVAALKRNAALAPWTYKNAVLVAEAKKTGGKVPDMHGRIQHIEQMLVDLTEES
ncbi:N-acetylmuramoyl-L-alanine amidase [Streptomyces sp. NPDC090126]|uniref:peptidoglycan recognition protein family protein n=1 Tax=Streptomyces sp. NPDC090126 TaxID=3365952 RepID=UPI0038239955